MGLRTILLLRRLIACSPRVELVASAAAVAWLLSIPQPIGAQPLTPNPFAPLPQLVAAASEVFADDILQIRSGMDRRGTVHVFYSANVGERRNIYYTNNNDPRAKGGWATPIQVNFLFGEQVAPSSVGGDSRHPDIVDSQGRVHVAWVGIRRPPVPPPTFNHGSWSMSADDVWYRRREADGTWGPEQNLTNYVPQLVATDGEVCGYDPYGQPVYGRQWWAKASADAVDYTVAPDGTVTLVWTEIWEMQAFDGAGEPCIASNPPDLPQYRGFHLVSTTLPGPPEIQTIAQFPSTALFTTTLETDSEGMPHLMYAVISYSPDLPGRLVYTRQLGGVWSPPFEPFFGAGGCFDMEIGSDNTVNVFWTPEDGTSVIWQRVIDDDWTVSEPTPVPVRCDGSPLSSSFPFSRLLEVTLDQDDEPVLSFASDDYLTPPPGQGLYRHAGGQWYFEPTVYLQNDIFVNQHNLVAAVERTFAPPGLSDEGLVLWQQAYVDPQHDPNGWRALADGVSVNRANGDVSFSLPLFSTVGHGPTLNIALNYKGRGALDRPPSEETMGPGWSLSQPRRLFTMLNNDIYYYPDPEYHAYAWVVAGDGYATALRVESPPFTFDFRTHRSYPTYLRAFVLPDSGWVVIDGADNQARFAPSGAISWEQDALGSTLSYDYDADGRLSTITDAGGRTAAFTYDAEGLLTQIEDPEGGLWQLTYYAAGEPGGSPDWECLRGVTRLADGATWEFTYQGPGASGIGATGALVSVTDPLGRVTGLAYGAGGALASVTDPAAATSTLSYRTSRTLGPTVRPVDVYLVSEQFEAALVNARAFADTTSITNTFTYPTLVFGGLTYALRHDYFISASQFVYADAFGGRTTRQYGTFRRLLTSTDPRSNVTTWYYTPESPIETVRHDLLYLGLPGGGAVSMGWTPQHEISTFTDPRGKTWSFGYGAPESPRLPSSIVEPPDVTGQPGITTAVDWDAIGRVLSVTDALGRSTSRAYGEGGDATGLPTSQTRSGVAGALRSTYTAMGRLATRKDPAQSPGVVTQILYDHAQRPSSVQTPSPGSGDHGPGSTSYSYDAVGNLTSSTDALGRTTSYQYDVRNRRIRTTRPDGSFATTEYDLNGNVTATTDFNGNREERDYDAQDRVTEIRHPDGMRVRFAYDAVGNTTERSEVSLEGAERTTTYEYDALNRAVRQTDPLGGAIRYEYDAASNLTRVIDRRGNATEYRYTDRNLLAAVKRPGAGLGDPDEAYRTDFTYDANGKRTSMTVWRKDGASWQAHTTTYEYDAANRLVSETDPLGRETTHAYDDNDNRTETVDPAGMVTRATYDDLNRLKSQIRDFGGLGLTTVNTYDDVGRLVSQRDPALRLTSYTYDVLDRLATTTSPLGLLATYGYDANGNRRTVTDANDRMTEYRYDSRDRLVQVVDPSGTATATWAYDEFGDLVQRVDGRGLSTAYAYDDIHRLQNVVYPGGRTITRGYDASGNLTDLVDPNTDLDYQYDALNRLVRVVDNRLGRSLEFLFDSFDNRTRMNVKNGATVDESVLYSYDAAGQLDQIVEGAATFDYDYNPDGTLSRLTRPGGDYTEDDYDSAKRLTEVKNRTSSGAVISGFAYTYDAAGNRTRLDVTRDDQPHHAIDYEYDALDRLVRETRTGPSPYEILWTYDLVGNRLSEVRNGYPATYTYDSDNQLTQVATQGVPVVTDDFEAPPLTDRWEVGSGDWSESGGVLVASAPADRGVLLAAGVGSPTAYDASVRIGLTPYWQGFVFHWQDAANHLIAEIRRDATAAEESAVVRAHGGPGAAPASPSPAAGTARVRLISVADGIPEELATAEIPGVGPWVTLMLAVSGDSAGVGVGGAGGLARDGLARASGRVGLCGYLEGRLDDFLFNGNGVSVTTYAYDANGNRTASSDGETFGYDEENRLVSYAGGGISAAYEYDALGRRIASTIDGATSRYFHDAQDVIRDLDGPGAEVARYLNGAGIDAKLRATRSGNAATFLGDALGTVRELTDAAAEVTDRYDFDAFGNRTLAIGSSPNHYGFVQRELDAESGLLHFRARAYDPRVGRFLQRDPVVDNLPLGAYAYASNNPLTRTDPFGLQDEAPSNDYVDTKKLWDEFGSDLLEKIKTGGIKIRSIRVGKINGKHLKTANEGYGLAESWDEVFKADSYEDLSKAFDTIHGAADATNSVVEIVLEAGGSAPRVLKFVGKANTVLATLGAIKDVWDIWWETHNTITRWGEEAKDRGSLANTQYLAYRNAVAGMLRHHKLGNKAVRDGTLKLLLSQWQLFEKNIREKILSELVDYKFEFERADEAEKEREDERVKARAAAYERWEALPPSLHTSYSAQTRALLEEWPELKALVNAVVARRLEMDLRRMKADRP